MGWLDRILSVFRPRSYEAEVDPVDGPPTPVVSDPRPEAAPKPRPKAVEARAPKPPKEAKPRAAKGTRKARKTAPVKAPAAPAAEVLPVAEAERRYGALARGERAPAPAPPPAPVVAAAPVQAAPPTPRADPVVDAARRAEAAENRRRARVPRFEALLGRADALLGVDGAGARDLASARRELALGWTRLGDPPHPEAEALNAGRDARLAALDERLLVASAAVDEVHRQNLEQKRAVVEEARALAEREDLRGAGPAMGELRARLRAVGPVAPTDTESLAAAFAQAEARLKSRQASIREARDAAREEGLERLTQLVRQAESLVGAADPEVAAQRIMGLQGTWKTLRVPGPRGQTDELWTRFRAACDGVFARRGEARLEASRAALERLEQIVTRAEALAAEGMEGDPDREIEQLLTAWKRVGRAPREPQQVLWERLGRAFDQLHSPPADLSGQDDGALQYRPFGGLPRAP